MKKITIITLLLICTQSAFSQFYLSVSPCYYNGTGSRSQKLSGTVEVGRTFDVLNLGLDYGRTNFAASDKEVGDTSKFVELRPTLTVFQKGNFSSGLTIGIGHVFNAEQNLLTEFSYSIGYNITPNFMIGLFQGNYWFDGKYSASKWEYTGLSLTFSLSSLKKDAMEAGSTTRHFIRKALHRF
jgi:hypothetical protein